MYLKYALTIVSLFATPLYEYSRPLFASISKRKQTRISYVLDLAYGNISEAILNCASSTRRKHFKTCDEHLSTPISPFMLTCLNLTFTNSSSVSYMACKDLVANCHRLIEDSLRSTLNSITARHLALGWLRCAGITYCLPTILAMR